VVLTVAQVATLDEMLELPGAETTSRVAQLERPEEIAGLLEVGADGEDLVNQILNADDAVLAERLLDDGVVGERDALLVDLAITALVDELPNALEVGVTVGNERLHNLQHLRGGLGQADEYAIVDLEKTQQLKSLPLLGVNLVDTLDTDDEDELRLGRDIVRSLLLGLPGKADLLLLCVAVFLYVGLGSLEDHGALLLVGLTLFLELGSSGLTFLLLGLPLLQEGLRNEDIILGRGGPVIHENCQNGLVNTWLCTVREENCS